MIEYADGPKSRFADGDSEILTDAIDRYFDEGFDQEFSDYSEESELGNFRERLEQIGSWAGRDVDKYLDQIDEVIGQIPEPDYDDGPAGGWNQNSHGSPIAEEAEIDRLFDGLRDY